jgi:hypothetical protein
MLLRRLILLRFGLIYAVAISVRGRGFALDVG